MSDVNSPLRTRSRRHSRKSRAADRSRRKSSKKHKRKSPQRSKQSRIRRAVNSLFDVALCPQHQQQLEYFCESCLIPVCDQCMSNGFHNNSSHMVKPLRDSFNVRVAELNVRMTSRLLPLRDQYVAYIKGLNDRLGEYEQQRQTVQHKLTKGFGVMLSQMNQETGRLTTPYAHTVDNLRDRVDDVTYIVKHLHDSLQLESGRDGANQVQTQIMLDFLGSFSEWSSAVDRILEEPMHLTSRAKQLLAEPMQQLPDELGTLQDLTQSVQEREGEINIKDQMIAYLLQERISLLDEKNAPPVQTLCGATTNRTNSSSNAKLATSPPAERHDDANAWMTLSDQLAEQLQRFKKQCKYCGTAFGPESAQTYCTQNVCTDAVHHTRMQFGSVGDGHHAWEGV